MRRKVYDRKNTRCQSGLSRFQIISTLMSGHQDNVERMLNVRTTGRSVRHMRETYVPPLACQVSFGTRHRRETLDSPSTFAQVDNTRDLNHSFTGV